MNSLSGGGAVVLYGPPYAQGTETEYVGTEYASFTTNEQGGQVILRDTDGDLRGEFGVEETGAKIFLQDAIA